jgi:hypothetical protein
LLAVVAVAVDDAWAVILFSFGVALVSVLVGGHGMEASLLHAARDVGGAILLGIAFGAPAAYLTGRLKSGQPMLVEALGLVFACGGTALAIDVSFLIAVMVMGAVIGRFAVHHEFAFHEIENVEWPFMIVFFVLAGASLELGMLAQLGWIGGVYVLAGRSASSLVPGQARALPVKILRPGDGWHWL